MSAKQALQKRVCAVVLTGLLASSCWIAQAFAEEVVSNDAIVLGSEESPGIVATPNNAEEEDALELVVQEGEQTDTETPEIPLDSPVSIAVPKVTNRTYTGKAQTGLAVGAGYARSGTYQAKAAGTYTAYATPSDGYCWPDGTTARKTLTWKIAAKKVTPTVTLSAKSFEYDGGLKTPTATAKAGSTTLKKDTDYKVTYSSGRRVPGSYNVKVTLKGNYTGSKTVKFTIAEVFSDARQDLAKIPATVTLYATQAKGVINASSRIFTFQKGQLKNIKSSNKKVFTADTSGPKGSSVQYLNVFSAKKYGTATLTYTYKGKKKSVKVVVKKAVNPLASLKIGNVNLTKKVATSLRTTYAFSKLKGKKVTAKPAAGWKLVGVYAGKDLPSGHVEQKVLSANKIPSDATGPITVTLQNKSTKGYEFVTIYNS